MDPTEPSPEPRPSGPSPREAGRETRPRLAADVVERVRRSEPEALGAFFDFYFDRIYRLAYRLLGERSLAEDATQEVCYRIQRGASRLDPERDPGPWVVTTTLNTCRSLWRSAAGRMSRASRALDDPAVSEIAADPSSSPEVLATARERQARVLEAVAELEEPLREVVVLHDFEGMDHKSIAAAVGLSHDAVRKRYSRALAVLARRLEGVV